MKFTTLFHPVVLSTLTMLCDAPLPSSRTFPPPTSTQHSLVGPLQPLATTNLLQSHGPPSRNVPCGWSPAAAWPVSPPPPVLGSSGCTSVHAAPFLRLGPVPLRAHPPGTDTGGFHLRHWEQCWRAGRALGSAPAFSACVWRGAAASQLRLNIEDRPN